MGYDFYLKLDGIEGECSDSKHPKWIQILSFSYGLEQKAGGYTTDREPVYGQVNISDISVKKYIDASSPDLHTACLTALRIKTANLELCQTSKDKHPYMKYNLFDVVVSAIRPSGEGGGDNAYPTEDVSLRFSKIEWEYTPLSEKGRPQAGRRAGWDMKTINK